MIKGFKVLALSAAVVLSAGMAANANAMTDDQQRALNEWVQACNAANDAYNAYIAAMNAAAAALGTPDEGAKTMDAMQACTDLEAAEQAAADAGYAYDDAMNGG